MIQFRLQPCACLHQYKVRKVSREDEENTKGRNEVFLRKKDKMVAGPKQHGIACWLAAGETRSCEQIGNLA